MELLEREAAPGSTRGAPAAGRGRARAGGARRRRGRRWQDHAGRRVLPPGRRCGGCAARHRATRSPRRVRSVPCATWRPRSASRSIHTPSTATPATGSSGSVLAAFAARPGPTVIIGEDAHWADGASLELLRFLGRRIGGLRVLFVVTYRDDEIGAHHPLRLVLGDLATAPAVHRISRAAPVGRGGAAHWQQAAGATPPPCTG